MYTFRLGWDWDELVPADGVISDKVSAAGFFGATNLVGEGAIDEPPSLLKLSRLSPAELRN